MKLLKNFILPFVKKLSKISIRKIFNLILDFSPYTFYLLFIKTFFKILKIILIILKKVLTNIIRYSINIIKALSNYAKFNLFKFIKIFSAYNKKIKNTYRACQEIKKYADEYFTSGIENKPSYLINSSLNEIYNKNYALILANSYGVSEPRLLRQCQVLEDMGITPILAGCIPSKEETNSNPNNYFLRTHNDYFYYTTKGYYLTLRRILILIEVLLSKLKIEKFTKIQNYITIFNYYLEVFYLDNLISVEHFLSTSPVNIKYILSHDYYFLPIGDLLSRRFNIPHLNDIHEYALLQNDSFYLKYFKSVHIDNLHKLYFHRVNYLSIVSEGIKNKLIEHYPFIKGKSHLVRNVPSLKNQFEEYDNQNLSNIFSSNTNSIRIIYSGLITKERGLEELLEASRFFNKNIEIYLVGPICSDSKNILRKIKRIQNQNVYIKLVKSVDYNKIISFNKFFDIGYLAQPIFSPQKKYSLANKVFEYMHAGLALFLDKSIEYTNLINENKNGWLVDDVRNTKNIVNLINSIDSDTLQKYKNNSLKCAKNYIWEKESNSLKSFLDKNS